MHHLRLSLLLALFATIITWPDEHRRGGILYSDWELRQMTSSSPAATPKLVSLKQDPMPVITPEPAKAPATDLQELPGSGTTGAGGNDDGDAPAPIDEVCVALASAAQRSDLPVGFFARLIWQESKFGQRAVSPAGAKGLAQFMPRTAAWIGLSDPFDPFAALPASAKFLRMLYEQFGNLGLAAAAYNGGPGRLMNWLSGRGPLPEETRNYVKIITGHSIENWTSPRDLDVSFHLPAKAPCEGLAGLSREVDPETMSVSVEPGIIKMIQTAKAEAAKRAARAAVVAKKFAAKKAGSKKLASKKTGNKKVAYKKSTNKRLAGKKSGSRKVAKGKGGRSKVATKAPSNKRADAGNFGTN